MPGVCAGCWEALGWYLLVGQIQLHSNYWPCLHVRTTVSSLTFPSICFILSAAFGVQQLRNVNVYMRCLCLWHKSQVSLDINRIISPQNCRNHCVWVFISSIETPCRECRFFLNHQFKERRKKVELQGWYIPYFKQPFRLHVVIWLKNEGRIYFVFTFCCMTFLFSHLSVVTSSWSQDVPSKGVWLERLLIFSELREEDFETNYTCRAYSARGCPEEYFTLLPAGKNTE